MPYFYWILIGAYAMVAIATALHLFEYAQPGISHRIRQTIAALVWPAYLLMYQRENFEKALAAVYLTVLAFFPPFYIAENWHSCSGSLGCTGLVLKSLVWAVFWPAYVATEVF